MVPPETATNLRETSFWVAKDRTGTAWGLAISIVLVVGLLIGWVGKLIASDKSANPPSKTQDVPKTEVVGSRGGQQSVPSVGADQTLKSKIKPRKPKPPPFDVPTAISKIDSALKEANAAKSVSDWGAAFQSTVKAWEIARHYRDDAVINPKLKLIEVALEELGKKANAQHEDAVRSPSTVHVVK